MAPENKGTQQEASSDLDLLGFDPESSGTALEAEVSRVEALEDAEEAEESQAQSDDVDEAAEGDEKGKKTEAKADSAEDEVGQVESKEGKFYFNGKPYESQEKANHVRKSYIGQVQRTQRIEQENENLRKQLTDKQSLSQKPDEVKQSPEKPASDESETGKPEAKFESFVNWTLFNDLYDDPKYGPAVANRYLAEKNQEYLAQFEKNLESKMDKKLNEKLNPFEQSNQAMEIFEEAVQNFTSVGTRVDNDGELLFPELNPEVGDVEFIERVAVRVKQEPMFQELGDFGVYCAYLVEKDWERFHVPEVQASESQESEESEEPTERVRDPKTGQFMSASDALDEFNRNREAAKSGAVLEDEANGTPRLKPGAGRKLEGWAANVMQGLEKSATDQEDKHLMGF
jgi:hypothetical protein